MKLEITEPTTIFDSTEAASYLGCSRRNVVTQASRGNLKAVLVGREKIFLREALDEYKENHQGKVGKPRKVLTT